MRSGVVTTLRRGSRRAAQGHDARCAGCRGSSGPSATSRRRSPTTRPSALLEDVALELGKQGRVRLARLDDASRRGRARPRSSSTTATARSCSRWRSIRRRRPRAPARLLHAEALAARARGCIALDVVTGAAEYPMPTLPTSKQPALAVRIWGHSAAASVGRTLQPRRASRARRARETPSVAAAQARAAWTKIRNAAASVAQYDRYVPVSRPAVDARHRAAARPRAASRSPRPTTTSSTRRTRADLLEQLALDELTARKFWRRGDQRGARAARHPPRRHRVDRARPGRGPRARPHAAA